MKKLASKQSFLLLLPLILAAGFFFFAPPVQAQASGEWAYTVVQFLLSVFVSVLGLILVQVLQGLTIIASYQHFIDARAVVLGWVIVRDICNMFFVVVLMIIAFGTILNLENYNYKKLLPKLILMAVLINFSKTICGLLIDVAQVVMLTFVNAFKDVGAANFTDMFGISSILTLAKNGTEGITGYTAATAYVLGFIYLLVAIIVIFTMLMMLAMRIVMIWIYVVLSPAAYLLAAVPGGQKYSEQWWSEFIKNLIVGPVLAFFIWLSIAALQVDNQVAQYSANDQAAAQDFPVANTEASKPSALIKYVIAIGMLVGGLMVSQQIGGAAGSLAGKGMSVLQKGQSLAVGAGVGALKLAGKGAMLAPNYAVDKLQQKGIVDLNLKRVWAGIQAKRKDIKEKQYGEGQVKAGERMSQGGRVSGVFAMTANSGDAYEQMTSWKGVGKRLKGGKAMARDKEAGVAEKETAESDLATAKFEEQWANIDMTTPQGRDKRINMMEKVADDRVQTAQQIRDERVAVSSIDTKIAEEKKKNPILQDKDKLANLEKEKLEHSGKIDELMNKSRTLDAQKRFLNTANPGRVYSQTEKDEVAIRGKQAKVRAKNAEEKIESNIPDYNFEARAAEQHLVSQETAKIKDITDPSELLRILRDAIQSRDKTMVKSIMLKMTKDYNDNEFLRPLAGRTDHVGLKKLMKDLSTKGSANYAGFDEQEAFGLGSQIAEINKSTNHAAATAAYTMEDGVWRETTNKEHNQIRDIETGKQQLQSFIRNNNRLAYGYHDEGGEFHLDEGGVLKLIAIDTAAGHKNIETMNESAANYVYEAIKKDKDTKDHKLWDYFNDKKNAGDGKSLMEALEGRLGQVAGGRDIDIKLDKLRDLGYSV